MKLVFGILSLVLLVPACSSSSSPAATAAPDGGTTDAGAADEDSGAPTGTQCSAARKTFLGPVAKVSTAEVKVISTAGGVTTLYVDASAGGVASAPTNPRVYIKLTGERVDIDDDAAFTSTDWDLALKRVDIYTNSGDAGLGRGGAAKLSKDFDAVTAADADAAAIKPESFFDADCNGKKDQAEFIITTFQGWYDYAVGGGVTVAPSTTYVVRGADGTSRYKVGIVTYTGKDDGSTNGTVSGRFILKVAAL